MSTVGMERQPFPLSFSVREAEGLWRVSAGAAQAGELVDLLVAVANDAVAVVSLETNSYLDEDWHPLRPSLIAAELGVPCTVHALGSWASGTNGLAEEFLVMDRDLLPDLLDGTWSPYELTLIDVPAELAEEPYSLVPEPGRWLPEQLIATAPHWIGALGNVTGDLVTIGLAALPDPWRLGVPFPRQADLALFTSRGTGSTSASVDLDRRRSACAGQSSRSAAVPTGFEPADR
ncbi:hypothetical protein ACH4XT_28870 [Streptomyces avidinii]|uniref:hypothetical protein n=1 Tax=Streptomyces avidinii TaxID=1895 RepID=UPI0037B395C0